MDDPQNLLALTLIAVGASVFLLRRIVFKLKDFMASPTIIRLAGLIRLSLGILVLWYVFSLSGALETWGIIVLVIGILLFLSGILMTFFVTFSQNLINNHLERIVPVVSLLICLLGVILL